MRKAAAAIVLALLIALMLLAGAELCHGAVAQYKPNSLGVLISTENPNESVVGEIVAGESHEYGDGRMAVNLRIHPFKTYRLFDVSVLLCGRETIAGPEDVIRQMTIQDDDRVYFYSGVYVFTYKRVASRLVNGIPCHEFVDINKIILPPGTSLQE